MQVDGRPIALRVAALADVLPLRHRVLRPGLAPETARFPGDDEPATRHFAAVDAGGRVASCLSFMHRPYLGHPGHQLRGMATAPELARRGIGGALLRFAEAALAAEGEPGVLWCNARVAAAGFYQRLGWRIASEPFDIPGVGPHYVMLRAPLSSDRLA